MVDGEVVQRVARQDEAISLAMSLGGQVWQAFDRTREVTAMRQTLETRRVFHGPSGVASDRASREVRYRVFDGVESVRVF